MKKYTFLRLFILCGCISLSSQIKSMNSKFVSIHTGSGNVYQTDVNNSTINDKLQIERSKKGSGGEKNDELKWKTELDDDGNGICELYNTGFIEKLTTKNIHFVKLITLGENAKFNLTSLMSKTLLKKTITMTKTNTTLKIELPENMKFRFKNKKFAINVGFPKNSKIVLDVTNSLLVDGTINALDLEIKSFDSTFNINGLSKTSLRLILTKSFFNDNDNGIVREFRVIKDVHVDFYKSKAYLQCGDITGGVELDGKCKKGSFLGINCHYVNNVNNNIACDNNSRVSIKTIN